MTKKVSINMSPLMKEIGSNTLNPTIKFNETEYEKILENLTEENSIIRPDFSNIDDEVPTALVDISDTLNSSENLKNLIIPCETNLALPPTKLETPFNFETPTNIERGFKVEGPTISETPTKMKGPKNVEFDLNLIERERVPLDCLRLEAVVKILFKEKKVKKESWIQIGRDTLKAYKINGARLNETRVICKKRGTLDFKIENEGEKGKEKILYRLLG